MEVRAKKGLGQHFLTDQAIAQNIVGALKGSPVPPSHHDPMVLQVARPLPPSAR